MEKRARGWERGLMHSVQVRTFKDVDVKALDIVYTNGKDF